MKKLLSATILCSAMALAAFALIQGHSHTTDTAKDTIPDLKISHSVAMDTLPDPKG